jgi:hypothetical protein
VAIRVAVHGVTPIIVTRHDLARGEEGGHVFDPEGDGALRLKVLTFDTSATQVLPGPGRIFVFSDAYPIEEDHTEVLAVLDREIRRRVPYPEVV